MATAAVAASLSGRHPPIEGPRGSVDADAAETKRAGRGRPPVGVRARRAGLPRPRQQGSRERRSPAVAGRGPRQRAARTLRSGW